MWVIYFKPEIRCKIQMKMLSDVVTNDSDLCQCLRQLTVFQHHVTLSVELGFGFLRLNPSGGMELLVLLFLSFIFEIIR